MSTAKRPGRQTKVSAATIAKATAPVITTDPAALLADLCRLIDHSRQAAVAAVNAGLTLMYWRIGQRIGHEVLDRQRASYGAEIVVTLSRQWVAEYLTVLPPREVFEEKIHNAVLAARARLDNKAN